MERTDEIYYAMRNRKTGAWLSRVDYGKKPPEPIDEGLYRAPKLFTSGGGKGLCGVVSVGSADDYEIVPVRIVEEPAKADREVLLRDDF